MASLKELLAGLRKGIKLLDSFVESCDVESAGPKAKDAMKAFRPPVPSYSCKSYVRVS